MVLCSDVTGLETSRNSMRLLPLFSALTLIAICSSDPTLAAEPSAAPAPAITVASAVSSTPRPPATFADALLLTPDRALGAALAGTSLGEGAAPWMANPGVTQAGDGATAATAGGAHHTIPVVAGTIHLSATITNAGSGFTGIALGRGDLSGNFWSNCALLFYVDAGGYGLHAGAVSLIPHPDPGLLRAGGGDALDLVVDTVARTVSARINGGDVLSAAALPEAVRVDDLSAAGFRINDPVVAGASRVASWRAVVTSTATAGLVAVDPAMCFVDPGVPATLRWHAAARGPDARVPYVIRDYAGVQVGAGAAALADDGSVDLQHSFARGYSEVVFPSAHQAFGVVALEAHQGPPDPFFGIDAGLSWLETDPARRDGLVRILARCGIAIARERLGLGAVNPTPAHYAWNEAPRAFATLRDLYARHGVQVLEMLGSGGNHHELIRDAWFPTNLPALAQTSADVARHWQAGWGGVEVENEPDLKTIPAEQYACIAKADSYALAQSGCAAPLVSGVFATTPPGPYFDTCAANGLLLDSDAISFHTYDRAPAVEQMVTRYRAWLAGAGAANLPLWHSESGWPWVKGPDRAPRAQDADSALEIAAKAVESRACGVASYFPFVYTHYEEGPKSFGMMGREATPLRSMAAYAMAAHALSGLRYLGDLPGVGAPVRLARVFGGGADQVRVVVLYAGVPDQAAVAHLPVPALRAAGADGREVPLADGAVSLADGMAYVWLDAAAAAAQVTTETTAARLCALAQQPLARPRLASPLVLQFLAQDTPARASARRYLLSAVTAHALPLRVRIQNLSRQAITVHPALTLPGGRPMAADAVTVPALGLVAVGWTVDAAAALDIAETRLATVTATTDGGIPASPLAIPLVVEGGLEQHLARHSHQRILPFTDLRQWQAQCAGHGTSRFAVDAGMWRLSDRFSGADGNWDYPIFTLSQAIDPATENAFLIRARILHPAGPAAIIANPNRPDSFWCPDLFPADGAWHVVYVPFAEMKPGPGGPGMQNTRLDPGSWKSLAIGMGSQVEVNALEVSHFLVVGDAGR